MPAKHARGAPVPAQVARKVLKGAFNRTVPPEKIGLLTNVMHWGVRDQLGLAVRGAAGELAGPRLAQGVLFGAGVWAMSYLTLVPMGLYGPPWRYPPKELVLDLSYHLAYGLGRCGGRRAVLLNLSAKRVDLRAGGAIPAGSSYEQLTGDPTQQTQAASQLQRGTSSIGATIALPPYSMTLLGAS